MQWLFWQVGGLGPMAGQNHHFNGGAPEKIPYAIDRYVRETGRLYGVLNKHLADREFVAGDHYSIADMASYPWIVPLRQAIAEPRRLPAPEALVRRNPNQARDTARLCNCGRNQEVCGTANGRGMEAALRPRCKNGQPVS